MSHSNVTDNKVV